MRIEELKVDEDYEKCLPELSADEYTNLERNIIKYGLLSPIIIWNKTIIDGHNRYAICKAHNITEVPVEELSFDSKENALTWILGNQLSRRNLSDHQRNVIAIRYKDILAAKARERQIGSLKQNTPSGSNEPNGRTADKLAKIAGTNATSIKRSELILKEGTEEQKERAMHGGKGNSISAIANEIKQKSEKQGICSVCGKTLPVSKMTKRNGNGNSLICKECNNKRHKEQAINEALSKSDYESIDKTVERIKSGEFAPYTREDVLDELKRVADGMKQAWDAILEEHSDFANDETIVVDAFAYVGQIFKEDDRYVKFI